MYKSNNFGLTMFYFFNVIKELKFANDNDSY
jgi:hypothetical protein